MKTHLFFAACFLTIGLLKGQIITTIAGSGAIGGGNGSFGGDGGSATAAEFNEPTSVAFDAFGNLYIADYGNNRIRVVNTTGVISTVAGNGTSGFSGDGGQATAAQLKGPWGIAIDAVGNLYIADYSNFRVRKVSTSGIISTIAGNGNYGFSGDGGQATDAQLYLPQGIAVDASGNIYIADYNNNRIRQVNTSGIINTIAGNGTNGYSGDGGQATNAELNNPSSVALDAMGNIYFADFNNNIIRKVNTSGIITTVAGSNNFGFSGDGGQATAAELSWPVGLYVDATGNIYIADGANFRIRQVNTSGIINTIAGNGTYPPGFSGDGGQATNAELNFPSGVVFDASGNLYIADENNNRIRKVTNVATTGIEKFVYKNGEVTIYPNPNNGSFIIEPNSTAKQTIQVNDINGKLLLSQTINGKTGIDASGLSEGVYNISIISSEGVINKRMVIVR